MTSSEGTAEETVKFPLLVSTRQPPCPSLRGETTPLIVGEVEGALDGVRLFFFLLSTTTKPPSVSL
jgi:hypothetical protein